MHRPTRHGQRGLTLIGFILVMIVVCFFGYMGMVIGPAYSEYYSVVKSVNKVAADQTPSSSDYEKMRMAIDKQFNVNYVETITGKDVKLIRSKEGNKLLAKYEARRPFLYNIDFVMSFNHEQPLGSKTAGD